MPQDYNKQVNSNEQNFNLFLNKLNAEIQNVANEIEKLLSKKTKDVSLYDFSGWNQDIDSSKIEKLLSKENTTFTDTQNKQIISIFLKFLDDNNILRDNICKFFISPLYPIIYKKFENKPLKEAITFYNSFKYLIKEEKEIIGYKHHTIEEQKEFLKLYLENEDLTEKEKEYLKNLQFEEQFQPIIKTTYKFNEILEPLKEEVKDKVEATQNATFTKFQYYLKEEKKSKIATHTAIPTIKTEQKQKAEKKEIKEEKYLGKTSIYENNIINALPQSISKYNYIQNSRILAKKQNKELEIIPEKTIIKINEGSKKEINFSLNSYIKEKINSVIEKNINIISYANERELYFILSELSQKIKDSSNKDLEEISTIIINFDDYIEKTQRFKKSNKKEIAKKELKEACKVFKTLELQGKYFDCEHSKKTKKERNNNFNGYMFTQTENNFEMNNKELKIQFNKDFVSILIKSSLMILPTCIFQVNTAKYKFAFRIGYLFISNERRRQKSYNNKVNYKDFFSISIENILKNCTYIEAQKKNGHTAEIKSSIISSIQHLKEIGLIEEYKYKKDGKDYTSEEVENLNFDKWIKYHIQYKFSPQLGEAIKKSNKPKPKKIKITKNKNIKFYTVTSPKN